MLLDAFYICMTRLLFGCQRDSFIVLNESSLRCAYSIGFFFFWYFISGIWCPCTCFHVGLYKIERSFEFHHSVSTHSQGAVNGSYYKAVRRLTAGVEFKFTFAVSELAGTTCSASPILTEVFDPHPQPLASPSVT